MNQNLDPLLVAVDARIDGLATDDGERIAIKLIFKKKNQKMPAKFA